MGVLQGLQIEDSELREYTHGMLGSIAEKLGRRFAPFLPHAVEAALASCAQARSGPLFLLHAMPLPRQPQPMHARGRASPMSVLGQSRRLKLALYSTSHKARKEACRMKSPSAESRQSCHSSECAEGLYGGLCRRMAQLGTTQKRRALPRPGASRLTARTLTGTARMMRPPRAASMSAQVSNC